MYTPQQPGHPSAYEQTGRGVQENFLFYLLCDGLQA